MVLVGGIVIGLGVKSNVVDVMVLGFGVIVIFVNSVVLGVGLFILVGVLINYMVFGLMVL